MSTDAELASLLQAVEEGDRADALVDNEILAKSLDWSLDAVAACLVEAKVRSFIWGMRTGRQPAPWYTDLEVTVQGRRFLLARAAAAATEA
jgi:hypothetical protein